MAHYEPPDHAPQAFSPFPELTYDKLAAAKQKLEAIEQLIKVFVPKNTYPAALDDSPEILMPYERFGSNIDDAFYGGMADGQEELAIKVWRILRDNP